VQELQETESARSQEVWLGTAGSVLGSLFGSSRRGQIGGLFRGLSTFTGRKSRADQAEARADSAQQELAERQAELDTLTGAMETTLTAIDDKWSAVAADVETIQVSAEKTDIVVDEVAVVWVPVT
jgi:hypothetical protein